MPVGDGLQLVAAAGLKAGRYIDVKCSSAQSVRNLRATACGTGTRSLSFGHEVEMDVLGLAEGVERPLRRASRPIPLLRIPPNGAASLSVSGSLIQNVPALISCIARQRPGRGCGV